MFKSVLFGNIGAVTGVYIIITSTLLGGGFALVSPSTVTATPSNTTSPTTTSAPIQSVTPPPSAAQQIINNTQAECVQAQFLPRECVNLDYESPTTVVLNGRVSILGGSAESARQHPNSFLWRAVDGFKAQGYTITDMEMGRAGNDTSPNIFRVIMSK
jgi:hypothetical protein